MLGEKLVESTLGAAGPILSFVKDMLARGAETKKNRAASMRQLAAVLGEIKTDLNREVVPRQNGHTFIAFLNLEDDLIKQLDKRYKGLRLGEIMKVTRAKIDEADLFIKDRVYLEKYKSGTRIDDFYAEPIREATAQIERLVGTLIAISSKVNPTATMSSPGPR